MNGRTIVVTGSGNGIGAALAERLARRGANLLLVDRDEAGLEEVVASLQGSPGSIHGVTADVSIEGEVKAFIETATERFGRIDGLVNNASIEGRQAPIEELTLEDVEAVTAINVHGPLFGMKAVLPQMKAQGAGSIVNTASLGALWGLPNLAPYIMAKHAVVGLTRVGAAEASPFGVRVNAVLPGSTNTGMMRRIEAEADDPEAARAEFAAGSAMGRYGEPTEVAAVFEFLLSDDSTFVTASLYTADGGAVWQ